MTEDNGKNSKKRVLHVITRFILGGAQENTFATVKYQSGNPRYEVDLCTGPPLGPEGSMMGELERLKGVRVIVVPCMRREINPLRDLASLAGLYSIIRRGRYDIVHTHSSKAGVLGRLAAKLAGVRVIVHTIHGLPFHEYQNAFLNTLYVYIEYVCALFTGRIITVSEAMKHKAARAGVAPREKFTTVYSGMNLEPFLGVSGKSRALLGKLGLSEKDIVVGKIARLFPLKGHELFIEAASGIAGALSGVKFLLVGDGILKAALMEKARLSGMPEKFIFAGLVKREDIPEYISVMDILVHTSFREGLARVLPQALASGKPAVSFDIDGAYEVVRDGITGRLVPPGDKKRLTEAVVSVLKDPQKAGRMGAAGREMVSGMFDEKLMVEKINALYESV